MPAGANRFRITNRPVQNPFDIRFEPVIVTNRRIYPSDSVGLHGCLPADSSAHPADINSEGYPWRRTAGRKTLSAKHHVRYTVFYLLAICVFDICPLSANTNNDKSHLQHAQYAGERIHLQLLPRLFVYENRRETGHCKPYQAASRRKRCTTGR